jgi:hypothetical protein
VVTNGNATSLGTLRYSRGSCDARLWNGTVIGRLPSPYLADFTFGERIRAHAQYPLARLVSMPHVVGANSLITVGRDSRRSHF